MSEMTVEEQITAKFEGAALDETPVEETTPAEDATVTETTPVEAPEPTETTEPAADSERLLAGRYKTVEELERAVEEQKQLIGRQSAEVAEARQLTQQIAELREITDAQTPQAASYDPGTVEDWLAQNPQSIQPVLEQARASGDNFLYGKALQALADIDQTAAFDYHANAVADTKIASLRQELAPALQTVQRQQTGNEFATAFSTLSQQHPDFAQVMNNVTQDTLASIPPELVQTLQAGTLESKQRVLETLYWSSKGQQAGNLANAAQQAAVDTAAQTQAERTNATVASTAASSDRTVVEKSPIDQFREQFQGSNAFQKAAGLK